MPVAGHAGRPRRRLIRPLTGLAPDHGPVCRSGETVGMDWLALLVMALVVWALCAAVIAVGRTFWSTEVAIAVHLPAAPLFAFAAAALHARLFPTFDDLARAGVILGVVVLLDVGLAAPVVEKGYAMFRSVAGTWLPFVFIFVASWAAGLLL